VVEDQEVLLLRPDDEELAARKEGHGRLLADHDLAGRRDARQVVAGEDQLRSRGIAVAVERAPQDAEAVVLPDDQGGSRRAGRDLRAELTRIVVLIDLELPSHQLSLRPPRNCDRG
jgi:hypothetical protein